MLYRSTRGGAPAIPFLQTVLKGLASDGGLYVPNSYPQLDLEELQGMSYLETAEVVIGAFAPDLPTQELRRLLEQSYTAAAFGSTNITPVQALDDDLYLLKLSQGPTLAFKDVAMQFLGNLMQYVLEREKCTLNVLGATSGDTGSAAAYALRGRDRIRLFMLSPEGRMSRFQQRQMYTLNEPNIWNLKVRGTFDDCQALVKAVNEDAGFKEEFSIGAVNSINWARIVAQVVYYVYATAHLTDSQDEAVSFAVPSGNFGNALAGHVASQMDLPIAIRVCCNENDVLHEFFQSGVYRVRKGNEVKVTTSPSMDIASASNFERWVYDYTDRSADRVRMLWGQLAKNGQFDVHDGDPGGLWAIESGVTTERQVINTIARVKKDNGILIDPHTAVAMYQALQTKEDASYTVVLETAQPAKFADTILKAVGEYPPVPEGYEELEKLPEFTTTIDPDPEAVKSFIRDKVLVPA